MSRSLQNFIKDYHYISQGAPGGSLKMGNIAETCERIKEEFNFIQSQYHSLKLECEKLAQEKTEMQRHYVMVSQSMLVRGRA